jgi:hypothetical protein
MSKRGCDYGLAFRCSLRDSLQIILFGNSDHRQPNLGAVYHREGLATEALLPKGTPGARQFGSIVACAFTPVLAKHTKSFNLVDTLSVGVDRIQRNFEPMQRQVESWRQTQITDAQAKLIFYAAFVDGKLDAPRSLLADVHRLYFEPEYPEFST